MQGHRGARGLSPENTLPSFETALDLGVDTLELDLHFSADGQVVVWHDPVIEASKCGRSDETLPDPLTAPESEVMVRSLSSEQLRRYQCDRNPSAGRYPEQDNEATALAGDDFGIVTLGELFDFVAAYAESEAKTPDQRAGAAVVQFNIETKRKPDRPDAIGDGFDGSSAGSFELEVLRVVAEHGLTERVVIQSFDLRSITAVHAANATIRLAALDSSGIGVDDMVATGATIWSPNQDLVTSDTVKIAHAADLLVIPWTVNDPDDMTRLIELGVDGLITDRPDLLMALLADAS